MLRPVSTLVPRVLPGGVGAPRDQEGNGKTWIENFRSQEGEVGPVSHRDVSSMDPGRAHPLDRCENYRNDSFSIL